MCQAIAEIPRPADFNSTTHADTFIAAVRAGDLFADPAYRRSLDAARVNQMVEDFDRTLLGIVDVSARDDGRYAIIDGQHRWAVATQVRGADEALVCRVHSGLTSLDEARLAEKIHTARRDETWWDRWRARRTAGDLCVLTIDNVLERHHLRVNPAPEDGNIRATKALETVLGAHGDPRMLDAALDVLTAAFGRSVDAFDGALMQGVALVLERYDAAELDAGRLARQLQSIPPRQLRARAVALRGAHRTTVPRLCAAVIVERYNAGRGRKIRPFFERESAKRTSRRDVSGAIPPATCDDLEPFCPSTESLPGSCQPADVASTSVTLTSGDELRAGHTDTDSSTDGDQFDESPEVGVPDPQGVRRALHNGRGLRWVMDTYGLDYPTAKAIRDEFAAA